MKVGILGGGQLALMLLEASESFDDEFSIFTEDSTAPALRIAKAFTIGSFSEVQKLRSFLQSVELVLFESEFVPISLLEQASDGLSVQFFPKLSVMHHFQDKLSQKELLKSLRIPTAEFTSIDAPQNIDAWVEETLKRFEYKAVFKWAQLGYDGKGNFFVKDGAFNRGALRTFIESALNRGSRVYAEELIPFSRELAIIGCRAGDGEFVSYPVVVSEQERGICLNVTGPATEFGLSIEQAEHVRNYAMKIADGTDLMGCFGLELFETNEGDILVNEIAPRVHNTGHYTQDARCVSQFENHLRAALGRPLGSTTCAPAFLMRNILGPEGVSKRQEGVPIPTAQEPLVVHWYGKSGIRPRRKLGHVNGTVDSPKELDELFKRALACEASWVEAISR